MGWGKNDRVGRRFFEMENGDYVICARGKNKTKQSFFAGRIASEPTNDYPYSRKLSHFINLNVAPCPISFSEQNTNGASTYPPPAIYQLHPENNPADKTICEIIERLTNKCDIMKQNIELLLNNHNLILTGAPGTGKTYLAKQIAQQLIFGEVKENLTDDEQKQFDEQCGFVQFHPSYDYTDFVEGLRPIKDENGNVGFERKDGVFKEFCKKALKNTTVISDNFDECWEKLVTKLEDESFIKIPNLSGKGSFCVEMNEIGSGLASRTYEGEYGKGEWIQGKSKFFNKEQLYNIYKGLKGVPLGGHDNYRRAIVNYMKKEFQMVDYYEQGNKENKNFVFIIDEINRGEISKIFGELFFSIDPGYRGKKGKVKTQYQNLVEVGDEFYDGFYVPKNVYIIGTMNDIDRSVESMDFAFRRRFAFKEIKADESMKMLDDENAWKDEQDNIVKPSTDVLGKLKNRMTNLNNMIWHEAKTDEKEEEKCIDGLSSAYHIGAAYFLKLKNYASDADGGFENLWNNHLEGLLCEYLRGSLNIEESIAKLKAAYNNESPENNG